MERNSERPGRPKNLRVFEAGAEAEDEAGGFLAADCYLD
jgi:hypothetical protein